MWFFRAVALDLDGTLAQDDQLAAAGISAVRAAREDRKMILVTGRILEDLDASFPGLRTEFDAVITENGAVLHTPSGTRLLATPVDPAVRLALEDRGIAVRAGRVLLALPGDESPAAIKVITDLGQDHQVVHNRAAAMIVPAGVTKGTGLHAALDELGLSPHNTIAAGDAENDLALLHAAEAGAAVANAVSSLTARADLRLRSPDGEGIAELLSGPLLTGEQRLCPPRRWQQIGTCDDGQPVLVPGSQASVLIAGDTGTGKSYLAGLLAEKWIDAGYAVLVIDPEGDHVGLARRPGVHLVDAAVHLPAPADLLAIARPGRASLVLDLSGLPEDAKTSYLHRLPAAIAAERAEHGIPHWVITDEAHMTVTGNRAPSGPGLAEPGTCLITWQPQLLPATYRDTVDITLTINGTPHAAPRATITLNRHPQRAFTVASRVSPHVRHQHKYTTTPLPPHRRFWFHTTGEPASAATLQDFVRQLRHTDPATVAYHIARGDFSRWVTGTITDTHLGTQVAAIERSLTQYQAAALERARQRIIHAIDSRYPGSNSDQ